MDEGLEGCGIDTDVTNPDNPQASHKWLYNAMIHPFLKMSIYGALWYQGVQVQPLFKAQFSNNLIVQAKQMKATTEKNTIAPFRH